MRYSSKLCSAVGFQSKKLDNRVFVLGCVSVCVAVSIVSLSTTFGSDGFLLPAEVFDLRDFLVSQRALT